MKDVKLIFQGDSITDACRDRRNYHHLGYGYPKYAAENMVNGLPDVNFDFYNFGIGGNRTGHLFDRIYIDGIAFDPDVISILIGINDIWARYGAARVATTDAQLELNYRSMLEYIRRETHAKIVMIAPFLLDKEPYEGMRDDLARVLPIIEKLAKEYADVYIPLDKHFAKALETQPSPLYYSADGVHPNENGSAFIGKIYADAVIPLIKSL